MLYKGGLTHIDYKKGGKEERFIEEMNGLFVAVCHWQIEGLDYSLPTALSGLSRWVCAPK